VPPLRPTPAILLLTVQRNPLHQYSPAAALACPLPDPRSPTALGTASACRSAPTRSSPKSRCPTPCASGHSRPRCPAAWKVTRTPPGRSIQGREPAIQPI